MGLPDFIANILMQLAVQTDRDVDTRKQKGEFIDLIEPKQAYGGFLDVKCVVCCPCGEPVEINASPPRMTPAEFTQHEKDAENDPSTTLLRVKSDGVPDDSPTRIATNLGHTHARCNECGKQFLVCWQFDAVHISNDIKVPWESGESPQSPSSELSFSPRLIKTTTH